MRLDEKGEILLRRISNGRYDLKDGRLHEQQLLAPIKGLQKECNRVQTEIDAHEKGVRNRMKQIREAFLRVVKTEPGLADRFKQVADSTQQGLPENVLASEILEPWQWWRELATTAVNI